MPHSSTSPQTSDLRTPPIAGSKSFLSNSREHDSIFNQKGDEIILRLSIGRRHGRLGFHIFNTIFYGFILFI
ncbi:hypothetical protein V6Z12_D13G118200 [Gossypium hirsutum]